ncbi:ATP-dependent endonuclease [uncultured Methanobrevibacter sp.]|uniref:ATP-dependent nuclease n=1 Tax=uncultured Methanobrevibacter sp. TaxID=253161 RepID=UPI0025FB0CC9|nr:AAA family ATPase [uncultured Methanobrevibacter sp.]
MYLEKVKIHNFRLLEDVEFTFHEESTLIVGKNNSGKTSLNEIFNRTNNLKNKLKIEDFNIKSFKKFIDFFNQDTYNKDFELPTVSITYYLKYSDNSDFAILSDFIIDLDDEIDYVKLLVNYSIRKSEKEKFYDSGKKFVENNEKNRLITFLKKELSTFFEYSVISIDPSDENNTKEIKIETYNNLIQNNFIFAQRELDDNTHSEARILSKVLFKTVDNKDLSSNDEIEKNIQEIQTIAIDKLDSTIQTQLLPNLKIFGYPGLNDPNIQTETLIETQNLIKNHTKICYEGSNGIKLPEDYNGLGSRNLIYILFRLQQFYDEFINKNELPGLNLIFIEEPEAHLHPQMQEVFIKEINKLKKDFEKRYGKKWPVQFVVTTHSSHISNQANFESIRYFSRKSNNNIEIKDLKIFKETNQENANFLHKFLTLTRCDLFFADKVILIEGQSEHILLPRIIEKFDKEYENKLSNKYISIIEVGGAYAHKFYKFLEFINTYCLVITDIDFVDKNGKKCPYDSDLELFSSNYALKNWVNPQSQGKLKIDDTLKIGVKDDNPKVMITFQIKNNDGIWPRSFEDAFILENYDMFDLKSLSNESVFNKAKKINSKLDFAIKCGIENNTHWKIPDYIKKGLKWLSEVGD